MSKRDKRIYKTNKARLQQYYARQESKIQVEDSLIYAAFIAVLAFLLGV